MDKVKTATEGRVQGDPSGPPPDPSPAAASETPRTRLLDAGLELFGTVGYEPTTIGDLCREAHVSTRDFYRQVGDRVALFRLVFEREVQRNFERVGAAIADAPPVIEVVATRWMEAWFGAMVADPRRYRVMYTEAHGVDSALDARRRELLRSILDFAKAQIRRCVAARGIDPDASFDLAAISIAAATRELLQQHMEGALPDTDPADIVGAIVRLAKLVGEQWMAGAPGDGR